MEFYKNCKHGQQKLYRTKEVKKFPLPNGQIMKVTNTEIGQN